MKSSGSDVIVRLLEAAPALCEYPAIFCMCSFVTQFVSRLSRSVRHLGLKVNASNELNHENTQARIASNQKES